MMSNKFPTLSERFDHHVEKGRCRNFDNCGKKIKPPRRFYCSKKCADFFYAFNMWETVKGKVLERDGHKCVKCGRGIEEAPLEVDHIIPIALGGDPLDPENMQILCIDEHKEKTAEDIRKIHEKKKRELEERLEKERQERRKQQKKCWGYWGLGLS